MPPELLRLFDALTQLIGKLDRLADKALEEIAKDTKGKK